ncbi:MAG: O-antigen ligase family protein [Ignavibacterium sp.]|nr:O-antigen ligase family protein [Ignavibacterium sp.]
MKNSYKYIFGVLLSLPFVTVFVTSKELYNGIITAKMFYFYAVTVLILFSVSIYLLIKKDSIRISFNVIDLLILIYLSYNFLRLLTTKYSSLQDDYFISFVLLTVLYFLWKYFLTFNNKADFNKSTTILITVFLVSGLLQAIYGLLQLYNISPGIVGNQFKVIGTLGNPDYLAGYLISIAPFALGIYWLSKNVTTLNKFIKMIALITFCSCIFLLPSTLSRTSWLALGAGILFILWYKYHLAEKLKIIFNSKIKLVSALLISLILSIVLVSSLYQLKPESALGRLLLWKVSINIIEDNPIIGIGFNRFSVAYNNYQSDYFAKGYGSNSEKFLADNVRHAHNEYLQIGAETGLIGLLIFLGIIFSALKFPLINNYQNTGQQLTEKLIISISTKAGLIALLVFALFSFPLHILPNLINFFFLLAVLSGSNDIFLVRELTFSKKVFKPAALIVIVIVSLFAVKYQNLYETYNKWNLGYMAAKGGYFDIAEKEYEDLIPELNSNGEFLFFYGASLSALGNYNEALKFLEQAKLNFSDPNLYITLGQSYAKLLNFPKAESNIMHASNITPHKLFPKYLLAKLYYNHNMQEKAMNTADEIINLEAKIKTTASEEIKIEMKELIEKINTSPVKAGM